ncbi:MAG: FAD-linked oxidase C-terminal domain-containing protein [Salinivirgaceae bacterium]|nr:FAD-linked oxidase C-terminal domain-containing protein [Salinivirgaceae bacterium]
MVGNNSCGSHSILYKTTREHLLEAVVILSDGSKAHFIPLDESQLLEKRALSSMEGDIYRSIHDVLSVNENRNLILTSFPDPKIYRRNSGYAIDILANCKPYNADGALFNLCNLLAGSEGTLAVATELKLNLVELPPAEVGVLCAHFNSLDEALLANLVALKHMPGAVELMDIEIVKAARRNAEQDRNSFFIKGNPEAILIIEFACKSISELQDSVNQLIADFKEKGYGYHYPLITGTDVSRVWALRKSGLGILSNIPGDTKPVTVVEDTAIQVNLLPEYIAEFREILKTLGLQSVFHAHIGSGEIHVRPVLNLKNEADVVKFRAIGTAVAHLVKKYKGSLSGEHGDGRLRSEFLPIILGDKCYAFLKQIKRAFDPKGVLNPGKIVDPVPMDSMLRYQTNIVQNEIDTMFDFSGRQGLLRAVEMCNGSADCRRINTKTGAMCPSYMATLDETASTRARANLLREFLTNSEKSNPFAHPELYEILDLCLSCKACKSECPSNIDMAKFKSEFLYHYHKEFGVSLRTRFFANIAFLNKMMALLPPLFNTFMQSKWISKPIKKILRVAQQRNLPVVASETLRQYFRTIHAQKSKNDRSLYLFIDEFTNHTETEVGMAAIHLLLKLGYTVRTVKHPQSGRSLISKGFLKQATKIAEKQVRLFEPIVSENVPLVGIEPSGILSFRDEYPDLLRGNLKEKAYKLSKHCLLIDEFIVKEFKAGHIKQEQFTKELQNIKLHTHCQQKAIATSKATIEMLQIPVNFLVEEIKSGCCGMAGSFGYEAEHFKLSMKIGEMVLFPEIRKTKVESPIAANGTSCRQQIYDGTGREALHSIQILYDALL